VSRCIPTDAQAITLGVDTHKDVHVAVALDGIGRHRGTLSVEANLAGYKRLVHWAEEFGPLKHAGVEGTGSFGAGLSRFLKGRRIKVSEVIRPKRRDQYRAGKSDPIDAEAAARAVLAGTATGQPKSADGQGGDYSLTVSAGPEPFGRGGSHQVRAALGGASLPAAL